ncbi:MAG: family 78 glycoside hydrolase catalytic domain [Ferruginibacter sp.]
MPVNLKCEYLVNPIGIDAAYPRLMWNLQDSRQGAKQLAYKVQVGTDSLELVKGKANMWQGSHLNSSAGLITYNGKPLQPFTKYFWRVTVWDITHTQATGKITSFETGMMDTKQWHGSWINDGKNIDVKPAPYFRKVINITKKIATARAYIAVAGLYELYINGNKIGNHRLDPMYTRFDRRTLYVTYDVTAPLQNGLNALGVLLGNGWYNHQSTAVWNFHQAAWRARSAFCMDLRIVYNDGSTETIVTNDQWKTSLSPVIFNSIYTAEHYDARLEQPGWNTTQFEDSTWKQATLRPAPSTNIVAQTLQPIRNVEKILSKAFNKIDDTTYVFDLGRNISGVSQVWVKGIAGTTIRLKHSERLYKNGHADMSNIDVHYRPTDNTDPFQTDIFILKGQGEETFMPRFNYKGFQYVEVTCNNPVELNKESLVGYFMHSDVEPVGTITSANPTIDKIWQATNNSYLSNLFGYPTDCPQREKNGWTGDAHIAIETGLYSFDAVTIYEKWMADHRDVQQPNGVLPAIIPTSDWGFSWANGPDWTSTIAIIPWEIYLFYGDKKLLSDNYENIKRYVDHINELSPSGITSWGLGDWVPVKSISPVDLTSSIYYFTDVNILAKTARLFSRQADYIKYSELAAKIKNAVNTKYLNNETGIYGTGLQTEMAVPLYWGIVPEELKHTVASNLAKRIEADGFHLDVGILGAKAILNALSENGFADVAYKIASQETFPSWGWWIVNNATTLYENWDISAKNDISLNHIMFGEIGAWLYKGIGGIRPDETKPGFKNVLLHPNFVPGLDSFEARHTGPFGNIVSSWKRAGSSVIYTVTVPANSTAAIYIPVSDGKKIYKDGRLISETVNKFYKVTAGNYRFEIK